MDILFAHSDDLVVTLLTKWLYWGDIVRLDTACASSNSRKENLHRLFATKEAVFPNSTLLGEKLMNIIFSKKHHEMFQWLLLRKVKVADLELTSKKIAKNATAMEQYFVLCGSGLQCINVMDHNHNLVSIALKHCPLKTLLMQSWEPGLHTCSFVSESVESFFMLTRDPYRHLPDDTGISFPKLKNLTVSGSDLPKSVLVDLIGTSTRLERIKFISTLDNTNLNVIKPICQTLQHLALRNAHISCSELGVMLQQMPHLTKLVLSKMFDNDKQETLLAQDAFKAVAGNCPALRVFDLRCDGEHDKEATAFTSMLNKCPHLREICVCGEFVSDAFLHTLATHSIAPRITHLTLTNCDVSEVGLAEIAEKCSQLQYIGYSIGFDYRTTEKCNGLFRQGVKVDVFDEDGIYGKIPDFEDIYDLEFN